MSRYVGSNPRITPQERGLIKAAIRRVFSRSALRINAVKDCQVKTESVPIGYRNSRPRVKTWYQCPVCDNYCAAGDLEVDHRSPVVPVDSSFEEMAWDVLIDNLWCVVDNLIAICKMCHKDKTKLEMRERRRLKKEKASK